MDKQRYNIEYAILQRNFPGRFLFKKKGQELSLDMGMKTSAGKVYRIEIRIPRDYPASVPIVLLNYPDTLRTYRGELLADISPSHAMHTLAPQAGVLQLCHYKLENWHPNVTLYKVALKCLIWLEAYENHLTTGRPLTEYLGV
ncbi:MAG: hypothetical protein JW739_02525 [Opitutales bacterium]|nr:hypothetical protein [Opitutales bacterium]